MKKILSMILSGIFVFSAIANAVPTISIATSENFYQVPESPSVVYNMNVDWKYLRPNTAFPLADSVESVKQGDLNFYDAEYDDSTWETVSVPHAINASDSFDEVGGDFGEYDIYRGFSFYRKHFTIPEKDFGKKAFIEFESARQSLYVYVNGEMIGYYEKGVNAVGFDITDYLTGGDNIIAVATDNAAETENPENPNPTWTTSDGKELSAVTRETITGNEPGDGSGITYQWNETKFNPVQGGITGNVNLYFKGDIYQTLPLYNNLKTTGNYIYATDFDISGKTAKITVESEIRNESGADKNITAEVSIVDSGGDCVATFINSGTVTAATDTEEKILTTVPDDAYDSNPVLTNADTVDVSKITISGYAKNLNFWSPNAPHLYDVYTVLKDGDTVIDVDKQTTGFRKVEYDLNDGGIKINEKPVWLTGYAQRSTNEWAAIGVANDWLTDIDMQLVKESNANFIRWMHIAPKPSAVRSGDKYGIAAVCPGADRETDQKGRSWDTRVEVMRDTVIYYRNSPSILFWEAGNQSISADHMAEMADIINELDPHGGRFAGSRSIGTQEQLRHATFTGSIVGKIASGITNDIALENMKAIGRYMPIIESEHSREEAPRRVWDDFSPPDYDYRNKRSVNGDKQYGFDIYDHTSESFTRLNITNYAEYYGDRVGGQSGRNYYSGAAALCWTDSNQHVRNAGSESNRSSGRVDPIRIKKESFYAYQVMQSDEPAVHIIGHWSYPQLSEDTYNYRKKEKNTETNYYEETGAWGKRDPKNKTIYVVGTPDISRMGLYVNGKLVGMDFEAKDYFLYEFEKVDVTQSGKIEAVGFNARGREVARHELTTAGEPAEVRLTPVTGPDGLRADGSDIMYYDVEVVDANGNVCPLSYDRINFETEGEGVFMGGFNSGEGRAVESYGWSETNEIGADFVHAECGVNRVFIRSTRNAGEIKLTAKMAGVPKTVVTLNSVAFNTENGLAAVAQQSFAQPKIKEEEAAEKPAPLIPLANVFIANELNSRTVEEIIDTKDEYTVCVNGTEVAMTAKAFKPDINSGVVGEVAPILDALANAGVDVTYEWQTEGELPDFADGELPMIKITAGNTRVYLTNGVTDLCINEGETGYLTNYQISYANNQLLSELVPVLRYISGIIVETDEENKTFNITIK